MANNPVEAEATGQEFITAPFGGSEWTIPLDVDFWPLDPVLNSVGLVGDRFVPNDFALAPALKGILGDQWQPFTRVARKRKHMVEASNVFAAAVGIPKQPAQPLDVVFGAIPRLLLDLKYWSDAVEATLADMGVDYRDRWRFQAGRRRLTLRQIHIRLSHAPFDSALRIAKNHGKRPHSGSELLLMDVWERLAGQPHPSRPLPESERKKRQASKRAHDEYRERKKKRAQNPLTAALDTARANAQREGIAHAQ